MLHLKAIIIIPAMWLMIRSDWLHDLFGGSDPYNWLIGAIGTAAVVGALLQALL